MVAASQKLQEVLSAFAGSDTTIKQLEEAVQRYTRACTRAHTHTLTHTTACRNTGTLVLTHTSKH